MTIFLRLLGLILLLNVIRYIVAGPIEQLTVLPDLFEMMAANASYFNTSFDAVDWITSFLYNGVMWAVAVITFHWMHPQLAGGWFIKSLKAYGLACLFFVSVSAIYMNHYSHPATFYLYNMGSGAIAFTVVAVANAWLYPRLVVGRTHPSAEPASMEGGSR
jgi:hypothetical protein